MENSIRFVSLRAAVSARVNIVLFFVLAQQNLWGDSGSGSRPKL